MAVFRFEALDSHGTAVKDAVEAICPKEAVAKIRNQGYFPTKVTPEKTPPLAQRHEGVKVKTKSRRIGKVKAKNVAEFARELATLQQAGLPILRSLRILEEQEKSGSLGKAVSSVADDIEGGSTLSEGMSRFPGCFNRLFVGMIVAGETGGVLDVTLGRAADFLEKTEHLKSRVRGAMAYPAAVLTAAAAILLLMMTFVIPRFEEVLRDLGGNQLNPLTRAVIAFSSWCLRDFGWLLIIAAPLITILLIKLFARWRPARLVLDTIRLKLPVVGPLAKKICIARWTRTLGTLLGAGVPILDAISVTSRAVGNEVSVRMLDRVRTAVERGDTFAYPLRHSGTVSPVVANMVAVGEETGDLDKMLLRIADKYDAQVDIMVASLMSLLEPVMIVALGIVVGTIMLAVMLPILDVLRNGLF